MCGVRFVSANIRTILHIVQLGQAFSAPPLVSPPLGGLWDSKPCKKKASARGGAEAVIIKSKIPLLVGRCFMRKAPVHHLQGQCVAECYLLRLCVDVLVAFLAVSLVLSTR